MIGADDEWYLAAPAEAVVDHEIDVVFGGGRRFLEGDPDAAVRCLENVREEVVAPVNYDWIDWSPGDSVDG